MRRAPFALLALFACTDAESPKPGDSGLVDSATAVDTADTADTAAADTDTGETGETGDTAEPDDTADSGEPEPEDCRDRLALGNGFSVAPDYASVAATVNSSCTGTDHQNIEGVQRVVFLGDSVTVGTGYQMESGDFAVCAKFGGRTDDLMEDNNQIIECIPEDKAGLTTLVVMTVGGNDLFASTEKEMQNLRDAVTWITTDKTRFPGKMYVVFANMYEFTDGFGEVEACPGADLVGYHYDLSNAQIAERLAWMQGEMLSIAVDTETDMIFLGEAFCGHGYNADDASGRCYRGADSPLWFDESCFHPNNDGHDAIAGLFQSTIEE